MNHKESVNFAHKIPHMFSFKCIEKLTPRESIIKIYKCKIF